MNQKVEEKRDQIKSTGKLKEENNTFAGEFELSVSDNAGNISKFTKKL